MLSRAKIAKPGRPKLIASSANPFGFRFGAVRFPLSSQLFGPSAIALTAPFARSISFSQGVLSFWMRYDSTVSVSGDSAKIIQAQSSTNNNSSELLNCVANPISGLPNFAGPQPPIGSVAMTADPLQMNLVLQDGNGNGLISVGVPYVSGIGTTDTAEWVNLGPWSSLIHQCPFIWNGTNFNTPGNPFILVSPCGGQIFSAITTGTVNNSGGIVGQNSVDDVSLLPAPVFGAVRFVFSGVDGQSYPTASYPANVYSAENNSTGGRPSDGKWHHYIFSFDTSQLVTDANGAQSIRVQAAIDGAGGPIMGGPLFDTKAGGGPLTSQAFPTWSPQSGGTGQLSISDQDTWSIEAPSDASVDFAYCYFGVSASGEGFYDLTNITNMRRFLTATGAPANLGVNGQGIPLEGVFMHTGDVGFPGFGLKFFVFNSVASTIAAANAWHSTGGIISTDGPPTGP